MLRLKMVSAAAAISAVLFACSAAFALEGAATPAPQVVVTPVISTTTTASGQPITPPTKNVQVIVSTYDIPAGASLPVHQHPSTRYAYVLAGQLQVTNSETGKSNTYKAGDFIVEVIGQWHQGANLGAEPVRLLVIDQVEEGAKATVLRQ